MEGEALWGDAGHFSSALGSFSGFSSFQTVAGLLCNYKKVLVCWFRIQLKLYVDGIKVQPPSLQYVCGQEKG